jgi:peptide/nickel transport system substrate-binding protein
MKLHMVPGFTRSAAAVSAGVLMLVLVMAPAAMAAEQPKAGGVLTFAVAAEPPSYDLHQETSFAAVHPVAPHYSLLIKFDQWKYPEIEGDVAESWTISDDGLTYTFKIRKGIKFHDGSVLTAKDVKATYDKIIFPPEGVRSARKASYEMVKSVEAPDDQTVVFRLKWSAASLLANLASPWNPIYKADILAKDPHWYEKNINGTGPFTFVEHVKGSHWVGKKNENYFMKGRPYLDGFRAVFIRDTSARVASVRGGRALIEFRGFSPAARDDLVRALGPQITVQESPWLCVLTVALNTQKKPFDDARVRRALSLAVDRWGGSQHLSQISILKAVGGVMRPGYEAYAATEEELVQLPGFSKNIDASRKEARKLLKEAGYPSGFAFTFKNRDVKEPYEIMGVWLIDQWRQIGVNANHVVQETAAFSKDRKSGNFEATMDWACDFMDEPDLQLFKYVSSSKSPIDYSNYENPKLDELYEKQSKTRDEVARRKLVREFEQIVLEEAYTFPTIWWQKINPHWTKVHGWNQLPSHYLNQDLRDVWLAEK